MEGVSPARGILVVSTEKRPKIARGAEMEKRKKDCAGIRGRNKKNMRNQETSREELEEKMSQVSHVTIRGKSKWKRTKRLPKHGVNYLSLSKYRLSTYTTCD